MRIRPEQQSIFALDHSYLLQRLRYGNPLRQGRGARPLGANDVEHDAKLVGAAMNLRSYPAPAVLLHTPHLPEIQTGRFPMTNAGQDFLRAVERRSGFRSISMLEAMPHFDDPASLAFSAENLHPSVAGRKAYAIATADLLLKRFPAVFSGEATQPH